MTEAATDATTAPFAYETTNLTISVNVSDLQRSIDWYRDALGFDVEYRLDEIGWAELTTPVRRRQRRTEPDRGPARRRHGSDVRRHRHRRGPKAPRVARREARRDVRRPGDGQADGLLRPGREPVDARRDLGGVPGQVEDGSAEQALCRRAALGGAMQRPQSRPYLIDTSASCVLASHHPAHPGDEARSTKPSILRGCGS